jgi:hypothetical protein
MRKEKDPEPVSELDTELDPDPYLWLMGLDSGGPKNIRIPNSAWITYSE